MSHLSKINKQGFGFARKGHENVVIEMFHLCLVSALIPELKHVGLVIANAMADSDFIIWRFCHGYSDI